MFYRWTMATIVCGLVGTVGCSEATEPLTGPLTELSCTEAISRADDIYVRVFSMLANPSCSVDADCVVVGAQLACEGFEHRQRPFAVHVSERELAESVLAEREELCGREAPVCRLDRSCYEDVPSLRAVCLDSGTCLLGSEGTCI